ncbi:hypothetical protein LMG28138_03312 [Pararobbsia alpina]|uniref:Uncharacterized protein n=1 Tax=Pararobbsia alpina TaxID=621374 RepID=A0A6S7B9G3_9BURK|nr:hypothetical protein LMG28138_03312 [Pararobbsia alpina]
MFACVNIRSSTMHDRVCDLLVEAPGLNRLDAKERD